MEDEEKYYHLELPIDAIRCIHEGLNQSIQKWSGGDPAEQENLIVMRDLFYRIILTHTFDNAK
tara:strand:- start:360 stop:548 length:189 start_codon:yes stop_codon:yes gene_type:complete